MYFPLLLLAIFFTVEKDPKFITTFNEQLKLPGNELSLRCTSTALPLPSINWFINGFPVSSPRLYIENAQLDSSTITSQLNISSLTISVCSIFNLSLFVCDCICVIYIVYVSQCI